MATARNDDCEATVRYSLSRATAAGSPPAAAAATASNAAEPPAAATFAWSKIAPIFGSTK